MGAVYLFASALSKLMIKISAALIKRVVQSFVYSDYYVSLSLAMPPKGVNRVAAV